MVKAVKHFTTVRGPKIGRAGRPRSPGWRIHWTKEGVKMENQKKPLLIRPSRTPKTIPNKNFCPQPFPSMGTSTWLSFCDFSCDFSKICTIFTKPFQNNQDLYEWDMKAFIWALHWLWPNFVYFLAGFQVKFVNVYTNFAEAHQNSHTKTMCWRL